MTVLSLNGHYSPSVDTTLGLTVDSVLMCDAYCCFASCVQQASVFRLELKELGSVKWWLYGVLPGQVYVRVVMYISSILPVHKAERFLYSTCGYLRILGGFSDF